MDLKSASRAWWERVKADRSLLEDWLLDQHRGEATAGGRIRAMRDRFAVAGTRAFRVLTTIADQEDLHASWVRSLLEARGLSTAIPQTEERYWPRVVAGITDLESGSAVGAHAEAMRLHRIEAIADDVDAPADVRAVFRRILPQERFHERAFRELAGDEAMAAAALSHEDGARALGIA